ncbi:zinc ABC transporter ATP-binding protein AztA [Propylenella binzhouense]|uniref:ABC transporter ATP-binding protein n=1 Tax=Propylenella binzhouense TaxID=2555902 RepID=A0A964T6F3_9HYPH|nr:zinc ABC transporter ATP-binding protein AztA [Propylenella binzhouense]MYZ48267.1 ABC transporter ATP-binding protein [Propylenella binzhouense]
MAPLLTFEDLTLGYDGHPAVHHLEGAVEAGSLTAVVGPNGSGKSTLMKAVAGMLAPIGGRVVRSGLAPHDIAYLPQQSDIERGFPASVLDLVALGLWRRRGLGGRIGGGDRAAIDGALAAVGMADFAARGIDTLSGGQLQRALFARVLVQDAGLILLDEPFNAIDTRTIADLIAIVHRWQREGRTVLAVLHDLDLVRQHFPQALLLAREAVAWGAAAEVLTAGNLATARERIAHWEDHAPWCGAGRHAA